MRFILILLLFGFLKASNAQIQVYNHSLTDSTLPYLYIGVDNAIEVDWNGLKPEEHSISISNGGGSIMKVERNRFIMRVSTVTDECIVRISNKNKKTIFERIYKVQKIKEAFVSLDGLRDTVVSRKRILENPVLTTVCHPDCFYRHYMRIVSFDLSISIKEKVAVASASGNLLSAKQINLINNGEINGLITIDNIRALLSPDGRTVTLPSIVIWYKG